MNTIFASALLLSMFCAPSFAAKDPAARLRDLNIQGVELPVQTLEIPAAEISAYGDNAVEHCYVFPSFVVFETDAGQVGSEAIVIRKRKDEESPAQACQTPRRPGDRPIANADGVVLGAAGPFLFIASTDSLGPEGGVSIFDPASGKKLLEIQRNTVKPLSARYADDVLALRYFLTLQLDCDLSVDACWPNTLRKNNVPAESILVRPECHRHGEDPGTLLLLTPVHVSDVAHAKLVYENTQPSCERRKG